MVVPAVVLSELEVAHRSDPGRDPQKQVNEDACAYRPLRAGHLLLVCDGMGGHALGQQASQLAVSTIVRVLEATSPDAPAGAALRDAIAKAGRAVYELGGPVQSQARPGSTCVGILVRAGGAEIAHVGDSRAYLLRGRQIWQVTRDHSVVQELVTRGALRPEQAATHPDANVITRALGMRAETDVELREPALPTEPGDRFLLASDGLSDVVSPEEMLATVNAAPSLDAAAQSLVDLANQRGGPDNVTVLLARLLAPGAEAARSGHPLRAPEPTVFEPPGTHPLAQRPAPTIVEAAAPALRTLVERPAAVPPACAPAISPSFAPVRARDRRVLLLLWFGLGLVAAILAGVAVWWILREPSTHAVHALP